MSYWLGSAAYHLSGLRGPVANMGLLNTPDSGGLPIRYWNTLRPRFCPLCLAASQHWRVSWELLFVVACPEHGCRLLDTCHECGKPLSWYRQNLAECACEYELARSPVVSASPAALWVADMLLARLAGSQDRIQDDLARLSLEQISRLLWFVGAYGAHARPKPQKMGGLQSLTTATTVVEAAADALQDWPDGFHQLLDRISGRLSAGSLGNKLGRRFGGLEVAQQNRTGR